MKEVEFEAYVPLRDLVKQGLKLKVGLEIKLGEPCRISRITDDLIEVKYTEKTQSKGFDRATIRKGQAASFWANAKIKKLVKTTI